MGCQATDSLSSLRDVVQQRTGEEKTSVRGFQRHIFLALRWNVCTTSRNICSVARHLSWHRWGAERAMTGASCFMLVASVSLPSPWWGSRQWCTT